MKAINLTESELKQFLKYKSELEIEYARKLASWQPKTEEVQPPATEPVNPVPETNYSTGTIKETNTHQSPSGNWVTTIYVDVNGKRLAFNLTQTENCEYPNQCNFFNPLGIDSKKPLPQLIGRKVKVDVGPNKINRFIGWAESETLNWNSEIEDIPW